VPIYRNMPFADYIALDGCNWSTLKLIGKEDGDGGSGKHYRHHVDEKPNTDTASRNWLRAAHCLALEPHTFGQQYTVWTKGNRKAKGYKAFERAEAEGRGRDVLTLAEHAKVQAIASAVRQDPKS